VARIRTIKPDFFRHEALFEAEQSSSLPLRLAFAGLWTVADKEGRFKWQPRALKLDCLPYDDCDFSRVLDALFTRGFIEKYEHEGQVYGFIPSWKAHQVINNRESDSSLPNPYESTILTRAPRVSDACPTPLVHAQVEGKGREGEGKGKGKEGATSVAISSPPKIKSIKKTRIPDDFGISEAVSAWATRDGHDRLPERLEHFRGYALANGKTYEDWDRAFMNAIRDDWAKLNGRQRAQFSTQGNADWQPPELASLTEKTIEAERV
jgi:hypothetical protein